MPILKPGIKIIKKASFEASHFLWVFSIIEQKLKVGITTLNKSKIKTPKEIIIVNKHNKIVYLCSFQNQGIDALRVKVALNKSKVKALHRLILLWVNSHGITVFSDYELSPSGAKVWQGLLKDKLAVTSHDQRIWKSKQVTIRLPKTCDRTMFYGVPVQLPEKDNG